MFDKYFIREGASHSTSNVKVEEKRAPTDESVRLLREMEEKACNNITNAIVIEDNVVNGSVMVFDIDPFDRHYRFVASFQLNGKDFRVEESINETVLGAEGEMIMINFLYKAVADELARQLLSAGVEKYADRHSWKNSTMA